MLAPTIRACKRLGLTETTEPIVVACSSGPDSAAALHLLRAALPTAQLIACYVDHGIRPAANIRRDVAAVRAQARSERARFVLSRIPRRRSGVSLEAWARTQRYLALAQTATAAGSKFVVAGHHRDDLVETLVLALVRGTGIDGITAMRARRRLGPGVFLVRPFLWAAKEELRAFAESAGLKVSRDETNEDLRIRRNAIRRLIDDLERTVPGARRAIARSATLLMADRPLLDELTRAAYARCKLPDSQDLSSKVLRTLPASLLRRTIRYAVKHAAGTEDFHFSHCNAIARAVKSGRGGTYYAGKNAAVILSAGKLRVKAVDRKAELRSASYGELRSHATTAQATDVVLPAVGKVTSIETAHGALTLSWCNGKPPSHSTILQSELLKPRMKLSVRRFQQGDTCIPSGRHRRISLARFLAKSGVPEDKRAEVTLLCWRGDIAAVLGIRVMEPFAAKKGRMLTVQWQPPADNMDKARQT